MKPDKQHQLKAKWIFLYHNLWPPKIDEFLIGICEDRFYPGDVIEVETDEVHLNLLMKFWVWPNKVDYHLLNKKFVMVVCPALQIDMKGSTRRMVVFELANIRVNKQVYSYLNNFLAFSYFYCFVINMILIKYFKFLTRS